ncbi:MAG: acetamidase/formamidase family protein [Actinomycetota bacterium]|nr:acetamidase/formamidase family protein [Actinomycetota bacterium]
MTETYLPAGPDTVRWGWVAGAGSEPVLSVTSGTVVTVDTVSHEGILADQGRDPVAYFAGHGVPPEQVLDDTIAVAASDLANDPAVDGPHVITGPIAVEGAEPGDVVIVEVLELSLRVPYGVISNRHAKGCLPDELPARGADGSCPAVVSRFATVHGSSAGRFAIIDGGRVDGSGQAASGGGSPGMPTGRSRRGRGLALPLRPFLGLVAVGPADADAHSVPPGPHGGNLDVRLLGVGSRLHLPVRCPGALVQIGDPHFAQGDGEVALTALEGPLRAVLRLELAKSACPSWDLPFGETDDAWVLLGLHRDLNEAVRIATRAAIALVTERTGVDRATAYAWLSAAADLSISQVVDDVKGVHFQVPKAWLEAVW